MPDGDRVTPLVQRIVDGARICSRARRDDLRRELMAHFEDAGAAPQALDEALRRFGAEEIVTSSFRQVYRFDYFALYAMKVAASIVASIAAALMIELVVNLRVGAGADALRVGPYFLRAVAVSISVILGLVTLWETSRTSIGGWRAAVASVHPHRLLVVIAAFAAVLYVEHAAVGAAFGVPRAVAAGAVLTAVCVSTTGILARVDELFAARFTSTCTRE